MCRSHVFTSSGLLRKNRKNFELCREFEFFRLLKGDTVIGNDVWIGQNAVILPGVCIGDGAIIGANSVVGSDVAPFTIVIGNPAKELRKRFDDELIELMLKFKWWEKSIEKIDVLIPVLTCSDLEKVKAEIKRLVE